MSDATNLGDFANNMVRIQEVQGEEEIDEGTLYTKKELCTAFYTTVALLAFEISSGGSIVGGCLGYYQNLERKLQKLRQMRKYITKLVTLLPSSDFKTLAKNFNLASNAALKRSNCSMGLKCPAILIATDGSFSASRVGKLEL